ncbi:MAG: ROK family protein [Candidatus Nanopelagicales bacterium]
MALIGAVEAGGTKMVCAVGTGPHDLRDEVRFPTGDPLTVLAEVADYFTRWQAEHGERIDAIGYGTFGPCDPNPASPTYGWVTKTPKPGWSDTDVVGALRARLDIPIGFDTDVNGAALGELDWGAAQGLENVVYMTIGTGIGGGVIAGGELLHGMLHPEIGHIRLAHDWQADPFPGRCPFHGDCLEGMAAGPAIGDRWGTPAFELPPGHPAWELEALYLAQLCQSLICTLSPERIVLGGGVMEQTHLFPMIRQKTIELLNGYVQTPQILQGIDEYIVPPGLGNRAGVLGCVALGQRALEATEAVAGGTA